MATRAKAKGPTATPVGLVEACADKRLLNLALTPRQRDLASLIEGHGTVVAAAGRHGGKSTVAAAAIVWNLLLRPDLDEMAGGTQRLGLCVANSKAQAGIVLNYARRLIERSPLLRTRLVSQEKDTLVLEGERVLRAMPCSDRLQRGPVVSIACLDEFAHFLSESDGPAVAGKIYIAVRGSMTIFGRSGRLLAISTPLGTSGKFWELHTRAGNDELPSAAAFTASTAEMNPRVDSEYLEEARLLLGDADFAREHLAEFTGGQGSFFEEEAVRSVVGRYRELSPEDGTGWLVGFDPSFSVDPSAAAVVGRSAADLEQLVVARVERWQPTRVRKRRLRQTTGDKQEVADRVLDAVAKIASSYSAPVITDQHLPSVVIEGLKRRGVPRVLVRAWTPQSQTDSFRGLRARIYAARITLPNDDQLVSELCRLRSKLRAGQSQVEIPRTGSDHCDMALAVASAAYELDSRGLPSPLRVNSPFVRQPVPKVRTLPSGVQQRRRGVTWVEMAGDAA